MSRFFDPQTERAIRAAKPAQQFNADQKYNLKLGMAIGDANRAGLTREATIKALMNGPEHVEQAAALAAVERWETNQRAYGKTPQWTEK